MKKLLNTVYVTTEGAALRKDCLLYTSRCV